MNILESFVLGLTQGITEFIPVSSSGHLEIINRLFFERTPDFHLFLEFINFGTLLALIIYYRKTIWQLILDVFVNRKYKLFINLILTSIPAGLAGFFLADIIENLPFFSSIFTIACAMGIVGVLMFFADKLPHLSPLESRDELSHGRAFLIGCSQVFALIPGTSRSGTTIIAGRMVGLDSHDSADYSFLASLPIMCGVCLKSLVSSTSRNYLMANFGMLLFSNAIALISGLIAIYFVMKFLKKPGALRAFGIYRIILALIILIVALI